MQLLVDQAARDMAIPHDNLSLRIRLQDAVGRSRDLPRQETHGTHFGCPFLARLLPEPDAGRAFQVSQEEVAHVAP